MDNRSQRRAEYDKVEMWVGAAKVFEPTSSYRKFMNVYSQLKLLEIELIDLARCKQRNKNDRVQHLTKVLKKVTESPLHMYNDSKFWTRDVMVTFLAGSAAVEGCE